MRLPTLKMSFYLKTSHRVLCLGNIYFYKPSQQLPSYFQQWGICQFAQRAISSLSLSKQIVCHRSQPETQCHSLAPESKTTTRSVHRDCSSVCACIMAEELLSCSVSLARCDMSISICLPDCDLAFCLEMF